VLLGVSAVLDSIVVYRDLTVDRSFFFRITTGSSSGNEPRQEIVLFQGLVTEPRV